jgi:signal transduction histidine kinase
VFVRDITGRKAQEREILRLNTSLEQRVAQRTSELRRANADLEQLSYGVAHDLRAPLAGIGGFSGVLERELGPALDGRARHAVRRIQANVARMDGMIESVLLLARQADAPLRPEPLDLTQLALEALQQLAGAEPARQVQAEIQPGLHAEGDPQLVHSLMENLLGNAWKFTAGTPAARIEVGARTEGGCPVFFVRDNGVGFDMAQAGRLFTVFQRLHGGAQFPGHGLGLVSARRVVERHGGRIWAEGAPGRGACIAFTLAPG